MSDSAAQHLSAAWRLCACGSLLYGPRVARNLEVCPECGRHESLPATTRIAQLFDPGSVTVVDAALADRDPLVFVDARPYPQRLAEARRRTGLTEAVVCVRATIEGRPIVAAVMDFAFLGGSLGTAVGELIAGAAENALRTRTPLLLVTASGGARMQEGVFSLLQMAKTSQAVGDLRDSGILTVALVTEPTYGGVAASFATMPAVVIAEPGARLGFAGPRVIAQTIREELPAGLQTAEFLLEHGFIDMIRTRAALRPTLARLLAVTRGAQGAAPVAGSRTGSLAPDRVPSPTSQNAAHRSPAIVGDPRQLPVVEPWESVQRARNLTRPTTLDYIGALLTDFEELRGDRSSGDCPAIVSGLGVLDGLPLAVIGHQKGHTVAELTAHRFGMPGPAGYRKALRVLRLAEELGLPVLTLIDTPGAHPGVEAERQGQATAVSECLRAFAATPVPTVAVVTGEGGSGGALAIGVADRVLMFAGAVYSVISPEGCASILWKDATQAPAAAAALGVDARRLLELGVVDGVIPEGAADPDPAAMAEALRRAVVASFAQLAAQNPAERLRERRARLRRDVVTAAGDGNPAATDDMRDAA